MTAKVCTLFRCSVLLLVLAGLDFPAARAATARPNVVLVITDDQGFGDLGIHGNPHVRTPNLDRFAREGIQLTRFYVSPVCSPTRASLLTGRYHYRTGVIHTSRGAAKMHGDEVTLAELLAQAGYRTAIFGKWHLGDTYPMRPQDQGFMESLVHKSGGITQPPDQPNSYFNPTLWHKGKRIQAKGYCTDVFFESALQFIRKHRDAPFFVYLATNAPHTPLQVSATLTGPYEAMELDETDAKIYGMVTNIDENFGRLLSELERLGLRDNTVVIFMTDNGPQQPRFNSGLRGRKSSTYEGGIRVPFFLQWPGGLRGSRAIDRIAAHIDVLPTLLDLCGVTKPNSLSVDGRSLLPLLKGEVEPRSWPDRILFIQCHRGLTPRLFQNCAAITQQHKMIGYPGTFPQDDFHPSAENPILELYDLEADPAETRNLVERERQVLNRLRAAYEHWFEEMKGTRNFKPGVIHIGTQLENPLQLCRYQDAHYAGDQARGWLVKIDPGGAYKISINRGRNTGEGWLRVRWQEMESSRPLGADDSGSHFDLQAGEGILEVLLELKDRGRIEFSENDTSGDVQIERIR